MKKIEVNYLEPGGIIWKVVVDDRHKILAIESRDTSTRKTFFSVVSIEEERFRLKSIPAPQPWWIGLKMVLDGKLIFQSYKESQSPEPKGVYVVDGYTGKELWRQENKIVHSVSPHNRLIVSEMEQDKINLSEFDLDSGKITREHKNEEIIESYAPETKSAFPLLYMDDNVHYKTILTFLEQSGNKATGPIEYLEYEHKFIVSFYIQEGKKLINKLWLVGEEGELLLEENLTEGTEGIGMSSFFVSENRLIFIKNKVKLALVALR